MRTVANTETIKIKITKNDLIEDKWIPYLCLSSKIKELENEKDMVYKRLRVRLYNSFSSNKYNIDTKAGIKCIDTKNPMKSNSASLVLYFVKE